MKITIKNIITLIFVVFFLVPGVVLTLIAVGMNWTYPRLIPHTFNLDFIIQYFEHDPNIGTAITNSLLIGFSVVIVTTCIAYPLALAMTNNDFHFKWILNVLIYMPLIIPSIALVTSLDLTFMRWRLSGTFIGLVIVHTIFCLPYAIKLLVDNLNLYQTNYVDVAQNLGANYWQVFFQVILPLSITGLYGAVFMTFIVSMSQYLTTLLIGSGNYLTIAVNMFPLVQNGRYQAAATYGLIFLITTLFPLFLIEKVMNKKVRG